MAGRGSAPAPEIGPIGADGNVLERGMPNMTYYVAMPFSRTDDGDLAPGEAVECPSHSAATRRAEVLARDPLNAGAVAFSRTGDPMIGEFGDAVVLKRYGEVPDDFAGG
jgi:hypothetical protein